jgi:hypothetical protein
VEIWVDSNSDNKWQKVYQFTDSGWADVGEQCGGNPDQCLYLDMMRQLT